MSLSIVLNQCTHDSIHIVLRLMKVQVKLLLGVLNTPREVSVHSNNQLEELELPCTGLPCCVVNVSLEMLFLNWIVHVSFSLNNTRN